MELTTLNKEYQLLRSENAEKFVKMSAIDPTITFVEEYWITSDHTMGNALAFFDSYKMAIEHATSRVDYRVALNTDGQKPFDVMINGKSLGSLGQLESFLNGDFSISNVDIKECNVRRLYS